MDLHPHAKPPTLTTSDYVTHILSREAVNLTLWGSGGAAGTVASLFASAGPVQGALVYEVRTAQAGVSSPCLSSLCVPAPTSTQGRKLPLVGPGYPFQCVPQFLLKGRNRAEVCQDQLIATEVPLYRCPAPSFSIGESLSYLPPGASPWENPKLDPRALKRG